jgi:hypothetical protein
MFRLEWIYLHLSEDNVVLTEIKRVYISLVFNAFEQLANRFMYYRSMLQLHRSLAWKYAYNVFTQRTRYSSLFSELVNM